MATSYKLKIVQDNDMESPRKWDNLCVMAAFHRRYRLGDEDHGYNHHDYNDWEEMKAAIMKNEDVAVIVPLYLYDHSGISISTSSFDCRWDSGQIGFAWVSKEAARKNWDIKRVTQKIIEQCSKILEAEIKIYDQYLTGDIYGFKLLDSEGEEVDSCWGFYGDDPHKNGMMEHIPDELKGSLSIINA
jgi:hypothetical protein